MTEKRYFKKEWEEEYYIFDSTKISEERIDEWIEYDYNVFAEAMQGDEVVDKLNELSNENRQLKKDRFICLDCKYCGHIEIGCLCEKQDHWEDFKSECNDFEKLKY